VPEYRVAETIRHVERADQLAHEGDEAKLRFVPLLAAVFAVLAGLSGIFAGRLGAQVLSFKNDALLHEVSASDYWNQYESESLKAHLYEISAQTVPASARAMAAQASKYRDEQPALSRHARSEEKSRDAALAQSTALEFRKSNLEIALGLFEVAIVLTSVAAIAKRISPLYLAGAFGAIGILFCLRGFVGF
jgi:hypothetical protein